MVGTMLVAATVPMSVLGFNFMSLPDLFTTTTLILELPGFNLEVFPGMNTVVHLGDDSTTYDAP